MFKRIYIALTALLMLLSSPIIQAQNQDDATQKAKMDDLISKQVEDMIDRYKLDDIQAFRIDTLLQHYIPVYNAAIMKVKASGAEQEASYQAVMDYWGDFFDNKYQQIFSEDQWKLYMKSSAGREKKKRDKRLAAAREGQNR